MGVAGAPCAAGEGAGDLLDGGGGGERVGGDGALRARPILLLFCCLLLLFPQFLSSFFNIPFELNIRE
jgi:hypothetical protein